MADVEPSLDAFRAAVQLACQPQSTGLIMAGRQQVLALPRAWVLERIEQIAVESVDLSDYWQYRRLLELASVLDAGLVQRFVTLGWESADPDVREAAQDFRKGPSD
jgi:hypothetical protein